VGDGELVYAAGSYLVPSSAAGRILRLRSLRHKVDGYDWCGSERAAAGRAGRVFAPDGQHPVGAFVVYAYNRQEALFAKTAIVGHPG